MELKTVRAKLMALELKCSRKDKVISCLTLVMMALIIVRL